MYRLYHDFLVLNFQWFISDIFNIWRMQRCCPLSVWNTISSRKHVYHRILNTNIIIPLHARIFKKRIKNFYCKTLTRLLNHRRVIIVFTCTSFRGGSTSSIGVPQPALNLQTPQVLYFYYYLNSLASRSTNVKVSDPAEYKPKEDCLQCLESHNCFVSTYYWELI